MRTCVDIPEYTGDVTGLGVVRLLESMRETGVLPKFYQASSSESFGKAIATPQRETTPFYPRSPYGCAAAYAFHVTRPRLPWKTASAEAADRMIEVG